MILLYYFSLPLLALTEGSKLLSTFEPKYHINSPSIIKRLSIECRYCYIFLKLQTKKTFPSLLRMNSCTIFIWWGGIV